MSLTRHRIVVRNGQALVVPAERHVELPPPVPLSQATEDALLGRNQEPLRSLVRVAGYVMALAIVAMIAVAVLMEVTR